MGSAAAGATWWQRGVIYHVYPRSFRDTDGDGVGDLPGVTAGLEHLEWLGVDAVWLSPIYRSPMADFGYDVSDHTAVDPLFGTLDDLDTLIREAHRRGMRVILDYVPNHTSDQHPWFLAARRSRDDPRRAFYLWRDPAPGGGVPNNWRSAFGGSAWTWDAATGQYYYHAYLAQQPDLDWRNPEVQAAMLDVLRFWLDRGVDGFRVDALRQIAKDPAWRDNPPNPDHRPEQGPYHALLPVYSADRPEVHELVARMREVADAYAQRVLLGELWVPVERLVDYYGADGRGIHLPLNFHLMLAPWRAETIAALIRRYEALLPPGAWPTWVLSNHDRARLATRLGASSARAAAMLLLTLRGTPTLYYGDELGMPDGVIPPDAVRDPLEANVPGLGLGRDPARTPMPWDASAGAGFTTGTPWLPLAPGWETGHVAAQREDPGSILTLHRRLLALRRARPALHAGSYGAVEATDDVLLYTRHADGDACLVALNLSDRPRETCPPRGLRAGTIALSTRLDRDGERVADTLRLRPREGLLVSLGRG